MISVLLPSRGRPGSLRASIASLLDHAHTRAAVEVLVAADPDDPGTQIAAQEAGARCWVAPERYGYTGLHLYVNDLAKRARGEWCLLWNDDMRMQSQNWDLAIRSHRPAILWPTANHAHHANIAPVWPRAWTDAIGHVSATSHNDTYLQYLGEALGLHERLPVEVLHDRADLTGNHDDATFAEGRALIGPDGMVPGFDGASAREQAAADAAVIRRLLVPPGWAGARLCGTGSSHRGSSRT
jgi:glycosyltransferase involved in cell wall biosynthesis